MTRVPGGNLKNTKISKSKKVLKTDFHVCALFCIVKDTVK